jgi:hypothetical protein
MCNKRQLRSSHVSLLEHIQNLSHWARTMDLNIDENYSVIMKADKTDPV